MSQRLRSIYSLTNQVRLFDVELCRVDTDHVFSPNAWILGKEIGYRLPCIIQPNHLNLARMLNALAVLFRSCALEHEDKERIGIFAHIRTSSALIKPNRLFYAINSAPP